MTLENARDCPNCGSDELGAIWVGKEICSVPSIFCNKCGRTIEMPRLLDMEERKMVELIVKAWNGETVDQFVIGYTDEVE